MPLNAAVGECRPKRGACGGAGYFAKRVFRFVTGQDVVLVWSNETVVPWRSWSVFEYGMRSVAYPLWN